VNVLIHVFFTSTLVRGERSASRPSRFALFIHLRTHIRSRHTKFLTLPGLELEVFVVQPVASRYTDCAIPARYKGIQMQISDAQKFSRHAVVLSVATGSIAHTYIHCFTYREFIISLITIGCGISHAITKHIYTNYTHPKTILKLKKKKRVITVEASWISDHNMGYCSNYIVIKFLMSPRKYVIQELEPEVGVILRIGCLYSFLFSRLGGRGPPPPAKGMRTQE
jgi:hypothetical protein